MNLDCFNSIYITQLSVLSFSAAIISKIKDGNNQIYLPTAYWIKPGDDKKNSRKDVKRTDKDFFFSNKKYNLCFRTTIPQ